MQFSWINEGEELVDAREKGSYRQREASAEFRHGFSTGRVLRTG
jgi:hypothetical protein